MCLLQDVGKENVEGKSRHDAKPFLGPDARTDGASSGCAGLQQHVRAWGVSRAAAAGGRLALRGQDEAIHTIPYHTIQY